MSCPSNTRTTKVALTALAMSCALAGCSDIYFDRRETIAPSAGDALQVNKVTMMVDPWPPASANKNIAFDGTVMGRAVTRYRAGRVIPPCNPVTSTVAGNKCVADTTLEPAVQNNFAVVRQGSNNSGGAAGGSPWAAPQSPQPQSQQPQTQAQQQR